MSQDNFWKQLIELSSNFKVIEIGRRHLEKNEKTAAETAAQ